MKFRDRRDAGRRLAQRLTGYADRDDVVVLALPRGGVPVASEIAEALDAPVDVFVVRKLGVPGHEELAFGALASGGARVLNDEVVVRLGIGRETIERVAQAAQREVERRERSYRADRAPPSLAAKTVVLVDDGLATGATMRAAVAAVRQHGPTQVVVAVPTGSPDTCRELARVADEVICLTQPDPFFAVGFWYEDFAQMSDDDVRGLLAAGTEAERRRRERDVRIPVAGAELDGTLALPQGAGGVVAFAHGSGSSRHSPRNRLVAEALHGAGLGTLLFDLLTPDEDAVDARTREHRFDIGLLAERLVGATDWLVAQPEAADLPFGYFGASTGAAAALVAADARPDVAAVVSRGGRPDLAGDALARVKAPTLLVVGGDDELVLDLNREALARIRTVAELEVVPGASHLFEEPGALEEVARLATAWFERFLRASR